MVLEESRIIQVRQGSSIMKEYSPHIDITWKEDKEHNYFYNIILFSFFPSSNIAIFL